MENVIRRLDEYNPKKGKFKAQREITLLNAREFDKGGKMILIVFENDSFSLPKQYTSGMDGWKEAEIDSSHILPNESGILLLSVERRKKRLKEK